MMLTDDEIKTLALKHCGDSVALARAIESLLLSKLAAAEMPEPDHALDCGDQPFYRPDQLRAYGAACAARMLSKEPKAWYDEEMDCAYTESELDGSAWDDLTPLYTRETP